MSTLLCPHWSPYHHSGKDREMLAAWNPPVVKVLWDADPPYLDEIPQDAQIIFRHYRNTDPKQRGFRDEQDATEKGYARADFYGDMALRMKADWPHLDMDRVIFSGLNEPNLHSNEPPHLYAIHEEAFVKRLHQRGRRAATLCFSVGTPPNKGGDTPPDYEPFERIRDALLLTDWLSPNTYWAHNGPHGIVLPPHKDAGKPGFGWWTGREFKCPWPEATIFMGEIGIDVAIYGINMNEHTRGWQTYVDAQTYFNQLVEYEQEMYRDRRFIGGAIFQVDQSGSWPSHDIRGTPVIPLLIQHAQQQQPPPPAPEVWGDQRTDRWHDLIMISAGTYGLETRVVGTVLALESSGKPDAIGTSGEVGLMQIMPFIDRPTSSELHDPATNIAEGCRILRESLNAFHGDLAWGLVVYNAGLAGARARGLGHEKSQLYLRTFTKVWGQLWPSVPLNTSVKAAIGGEPAPTPEPGPMLDPLEKPTWNSEESTREIQDALDFLRQAQAKLDAAHIRLKEQVTIPLYKQRGINPPS